MNRAEFWYVFGFFALLTLVVWLHKVRQIRTPAHVAFTLMFVLGVSGTLSKLPLVAPRLDALFGANAAWLQADILFLAGLCAASIWVDLMSQPTLTAPGWRWLLAKKRVWALAAVSLWMIAAARLEADLWGSLERGAVEVSGSLILLSARLAYLSLNSWFFIYLAGGINRHRQLIQSRKLYIRLTLAFMAARVAVLAPLIQIAALLLYAGWPALSQTTWPTIWLLFTAMQLAAFVLMFMTFFGPAYGLLIWLDKRWLAHRLQRLVSAWPPALRHQPDSRPPVDAVLTSLVNEIAVQRRLAGHSDTPTGTDAYTQGHWYLKAAK